jgi:hypothetical protein
MSNPYKFEIRPEKIFLRMPEIFIQIPPEIPRENFKPILTQEQKIELVEKCLRLKAAKVPGFHLQGIKRFYENYFPAEFHAHNTNNDWHKCHLSSLKVVRLTKDFNEKNFELFFFKFNSKFNENQNFDLGSFFLHLRG